jgi:hypothetical protein
MSAEVRVVRSAAPVAADRTVELQPFDRAKMPGSTTSATIAREAKASAQ